MLFVSKYLEPYIFWNRYKNILFQTRLSFFKPDLDTKLTYSNQRFLEETIQIIGNQHKFSFKITPEVTLI